MLRKKKKGRKKSGSGGVRVAFQISAGVRAGCVGCLDRDGSPEPQGACRPLRSHSDRLWDCVLGLQPSPAAEKHSSGSLFVP